MFNYLVLLGWSPGNDEEIMSKSDIVKKFSIEKISESPAVFDQEKLEWMNGIYIRKLSVDKLSKALISYLQKPEIYGGLPDHIKRPINHSKVKSIAPFIQERLKTLKDSTEMLDFFFLPDEDIKINKNDYFTKNNQIKDILKSLNEGLNIINKIEKFKADELELQFRTLSKDLNIKPGILFTPIRISVTGKKIAPPLFETLETLGRERCLSRINKAIKLLKE